MPSTRDIQQHFGFASQTAAMSHLRALERKGAIRRLPGKARAVAFPEDIDRVETVVIPVMNGQRKHSATDGAELPAGRITIDIDSIGTQHGTKPFAIRVSDDSLAGAHICNGDNVILVEREPASNDIVAAVISGQMTLKRYVLDEGEAWLHCESESRQPAIPAKDIPIKGVMVGLFRGVKSAVPAAV